MQKSKISVGCADVTKISASMDDSCLAAKQENPSPIKKSIILVESSNKS